MPLDIKQITDQLSDALDLENPICKDLGTPTNDVVQVMTRDAHFALKLYTVTARDEIQWEIDLLLHLLEHDAPVVRPARGKAGYLNTFVLNSEERIGVLFEWATGEKPEDSRNTYTLIGKAAARIHQAADTFMSSLSHTKYDAGLLIDEQLERMRPLLIESGQLQRVVDLTNRLRSDPQEYLKSHFVPFTEDQDAGHKAANKRRKQQAGLIYEPRNRLYKRAHSLRIKVPTLWR